MKTFAAIFAGTLFSPFVFASLFAGLQEPPRELPGLQNVHQATSGIFLGSEPHGEEAFASLQKLGVTAIVSVDGVMPDVAMAEKYGIRYIHVPIGYDGIHDDAAKTLTRVAREIRTPIYVHCHHGKHRGPAAAAILCIASGALSNDQAAALMVKAGTGKDYTGLWRDVKKFQPPARGVELPELVQIAEVESLAAVMAKLDRSFDHVKLCAKAGWKAPADHPDLVPATEALLVQEGLHECLRHLEPGHNEQFRTWLRESDTLAMQLCNAIQADQAAAAEATVLALEKSCAQCHVTYRNK